MGDVVDFDGFTTLPVDPDWLLQKAIGQMARVVIIGVDKDGKEFLASSVADCGTILWDVERARLAVLRMGDEKP